MTTKTQQALPAPAPLFRRKNRDAIVSRETLIIQPPRLGTYWHSQGGVYVGVMPGENGLPDYHLITADERGEIDRITWADQADHQPGALSLIDGLANTLALLASDISFPAALWTGCIEIDGHSDFYLPAKNEALACYVAAAHLFKKDCWYFTSTQHAHGAGYAWMQSFYNGGQYDTHKSGEFRARAVRRILIIQ